MKTTNNNIFECYLPVFWGFYGSIWEDIDFSGEAEHFNLPENFPFYDYLNYSDYHNALAKVFVNAVQSEMSEYILSAEFLDIDSPQYYNFTNDKIAVKVTIDKKKIKKYIYEHLEQFEQYLVDHHKSRDGFNSFYAHDFESWKEYTANFTDYTKEGYVCLTSILRFIAEQEQITEECLYEASYQVLFSEFYSEEFYEIVNGKINEVKPFILENYSKFSNDGLIEQIKIKYEDEDTLDIIVNAANECIKEIENQTLELNFTDKK